MAMLHDGKVAVVFLQLLDYGEITEREATVIGRKGQRSSPPQFNLPTSVAADRLGRIYVADFANGRIQVLDATGQEAREPLNIGGKCRPCAVVVSAHGDLVMTDSQIIRVFSRTGEPKQPIGSCEVRRTSDEQSLL